MANLAVLLVGCLVGSFPTVILGETGMRCYACTSYIDQCKTGVEPGNGDVFKTRCNTKCFVRHGEDGAIYRGCFDGFVGVPNLRGDYVGCKNMTWPFDNSMTWCLCDNDLCNGITMDDMVHYKSTGGKAVQNEIIKGETYEYEYKDERKTTEPYMETPKSKMAKYAKEGPEDDDEEEAGIEEDSTQYQMQETNHGVVYDELHVPASGNQVPEYPPTYPAPEENNREPPPRQEYEFRDIYFPPDPNSPEFEAHRRDMARGEVSQSGDGYRAGDAFLKPRLLQQEFYQSRDADQMPRYEGNRNKNNFQGPPLPPYEGFGLDVDKLKTLPFPAELAERISCGRTGFYQNPDDCRTFVACIHDPRSTRPIMHLMRCPESLVWDNTEKICKELSSTCNVMMSNSYGDTPQFEIHEVQDNRLDPLQQLLGVSKDRYQEVELFPSDFYDTDSNDYQNNQITHSENNVEQTPQEQESYPPQEPNSYTPQNANAYPPQDPNSYPPPDLNPYPQQPNSYHNLEQNTFLKDQNSYPPQDQNSYPPQNQNSYPTQDQNSYPPQDQNSYPPQDQNSSPPEDQRYPSESNNYPNSFYQQSNLDNYKHFGSNEFQQQPVQPNNNNNNAYGSSSGYPPQQNYQPSPPNTYNPPTSFAPKVEASPSKDQMNYQSQPNQNYPPAENNDHGPPTEQYQQPTPNTYQVPKPNQFRNQFSVDFKRPVGKPTFRFGPKPPSQHQLNDPAQPGPQESGDQIGYQEHDDQSGNPPAPTEE